MKDMFSLKQQVNNLPNSSGCYLFFNIKNEVLYIGKAKLLKNRVRSYFVNSHSNKIQHLVKEIDHLQFIVTENEKAALILEYNLIQTYQPSFNILLKDDKHYPYIVISKGSNPYYLYSYRNINNAQFTYGPLPAGSKSQELYRLLQTAFPLWKCRKVLKKPCLYYQIGQCSGACFKKVPQSYYDNQLKNIKNFFNYKTEKISAILNQQMITCAKNHQFEQAAKIRNLISKLTWITAKQGVDLNSKFKNIDVVDFIVKNNYLYLIIMIYRNKVLINRIIKKINGAEQYEQAIRLCLINYYNDNLLPQKIIVNKAIEINDLNILFNNKIVVANSSNYQNLIHLAHSNLLAILKDQNFALNDDNITVGNQNLILNLKKIFSLENKPHIINIFDISTWNKDQIVGGCLTIVEGQIINHLKRFYNINLSNQNDYESMYLTILKHLNHQIKSKQLLPNLIIVDGGKIQIKACLKVLNELNLEIDILGLVKNQNHKTKAIITKDFQTIVLKKQNIIFKFLKTLQEEVHNYVINKFMNKKALNLQQSILLKVPGISKIRVQKLYLQFHDVKKMKKAKFDDLNLVIKNKVVTKNLQTFLNNIEIK